MTKRIPWTVAVPPLAIVLLALTWHRSLPGPVVAVVAIFLAGTVLAAVHHAEVVAHRVGEPFGSLVLAVAVTVIEVAGRRRGRGPASTSPSPSPPSPSPPPG
jgi:Ca2+:H+ antiporter